MTCAVLNTPKHVGKDSHVPCTHYVTEIDVCIGLIWVVSLVLL